MGYTHYWEIDDQQPLERGPFEHWVREAEAVADASRIRLAGWNGERTTSPEFEPAEVLFNGCAKYSHESFGVREGDTGFHFCKTARKPYDEIVTACLILLAGRFPQVTVSSDGTAAEWTDGLRLARMINPAAVIPPTVER